MQSRMAMAAAAVRAYGSSIYDFKTEGEEEDKQYSTQLHAEV